MSQSVVVDVNLLNNAAREVVDAELAAKQYDAQKAGEWASQITTKVLTKLSQTPQHKFSVSTVVLQKKNAGVHVASGAWIDKAKDTQHTYQYQNDSLICIVLLTATAV